MHPTAMRYSSFFLQKTILSIILIAGLNSLLQAQISVSKKDSSILHLNPLLVSALKNPLRPATGLNDRFRRPNNQLMSWPNYSLTAAQIMERDKKYDQPVGKQIASDIAESYINSILNGKNKKPVVAAPRF
jgi:hypothetical protein